MPIEIRGQKSGYLTGHHDTLLKVINDNYDVRGSLLSKLIIQCLDQNEIVSKGGRKQYNGHIQEEVFDFFKGHAQAFLAEAYAEPNDLQSSDR